MDINDAFGNYSADEFGDHDEFDLDECIDIIKEYANYYNIDLKSIDLLKQIDFKKLADKEYICAVAPMLNQLTKGALIYNMIEGGISLDDLLYDMEVYKASMLCDIMTLSEASWNIVDLIADSNCKHPSILRYLYLMGGVSNYEDMIQDLHVLIQANNPIITGILLDMYNSIYCNTVIQSDAFYRSMIINFDVIDDPVKLLKYLEASAINYNHKRILLTNTNENCIIYHDTDDIKPLSNYSFKLSGNKKEIVLSNTFGMLSNLCNTEELDKDIKDAFKQIIGDYESFKDSQYNYIKQSTEEQKLLILHQ